MASKKHVAQQAESLPAWYWASGLHDAGITAVESLVFPRDYGTFDGQKRSGIRNLLKLKIDGKGALYDTSVKEIRLYNYKLLTPAASLENRKTSWWLSDRLTACDGGFVLEIDLCDLDADPENFTCRIQFEKAEVVR